MRKNVFQSKGENNMGQIFNDYEIPAGYIGILYSGDVFFFYEGDDFDYASGNCLSEGDASSTEWYEDLDECIETFNTVDWSRVFTYPNHNYDYGRIIIDGIELDGSEQAGITGWDYARLDEPAYAGDLIENPQRWQ